MTTHDIVHRLVKIQKMLLAIKSLSASDAIDTLCIRGISEIVSLGDEIHPNLMRDIKTKYADPMA